MKNQKKSSNIAIIAVFFRRNASYSSAFESHF